MELADLIRLNELWRPVYPYLAKQVEEILPAGTERVLELGPFSGGLTWALAETSPYAVFTIGEERQEVRNWLEEESRRLGLANRLHIVETPLKPLAFPSEAFDGLIFRGAFFFLDTDILREIYRVLKRGGRGLVGGGFGRFTPSDVIKGIAGESRQLNYCLGKKWMAVDELESLVRNAGLHGCCRICTEGGLWLIITKD
ncbi:MAG: class I SAM-dependent methyltransferase [Thermoanaerobacteraceae bacterium]|nr:class I SAM-dependent methyltransferase [Thermoanaerobacteraceae bacterium]